MLIGFRFQNFRSFLAEQSFSFSTSSDRTHESTHLIKTGMKAVPRISKAAIVFGPNASGKTNLLIALATFRDLILSVTGKDYPAILPTGYVRLNEVIASERWYGGVAPACPIA